MATPAANTEDHRHPHAPGGSGTPAGGSAAPAVASRGRRGEEHAGSPGTLGRPQCDGEHPSCRAGRLRDGFATSFLTTPVYSLTGRLSVDASP